MKTLKGNITISRPHRSDGLKTVEIRVLDASSGCEAISIVVPLDGFAEALMGLGHIACEYELNDSGVIGKTHEHKTVIIKIPDGEYNQKKRLAVIKLACAAIEVDGWKARYGDAENFHRRHGSNIDGTANYSVTFDRFV